MTKAVTIPLNDLSRAIDRDQSMVQEAIANVLATHHVILGPHVTRFESELASYLNVEHVIGVASGTDALELAIKAAMPEGKRTVITATNAGGYTTVAARRAGFNVSYADIDPNTMCLSHESVTETVTEDTGVVVLTHLYGALTDFSALQQLCERNGIALVEDTAQALGAHRSGKYAGTIGDVGTTSFYPTKNLGALGDGGAVFTRSSSIATRVRELRQYGWSKKYRVTSLGGVNSRLDDMQAAILSARLPQLDNFNRRRREIIQHYRSQATGSMIEILPAEDEAHAAHLAVAVCEQRESVIEQLAERGVQTDIHFPVPDHLQPAWNVAARSLPHSERAAEQVLSLPCFPELTDAEVEHVGNAIRALK